MELNWGILPAVSMPLQQSHDNVYNFNLDFVNIYYNRYHYMSMIFSTLSNSIESTHKIRCPLCHGTGGEKNHISSCPYCHGSGIHSVFLFLFLHSLRLCIPSYRILHNPSHVSVLSVMVMVRYLILLIPVLVVMYFYIRRCQVV